MNKNHKGFISVVSVVLSAMTLFFAGCKDNGNTQNNSTTTEKEEVTVSTTETMLYHNGVSPYSIVLPEKPSSTLTLAAEELQYFFELASGCKLDIIQDSAVTDTDGKYLSIGKTRIFEASGMEIDWNELKDDGYKVKTFGDAIVMAGGSDTGTLYSVYGYLSKQFDLEIFSYDVFTYDTLKTQYLLDIDWTDIPDIATRDGGTYLTTISAYQRRYRMGTKGTRFGEFGHSNFRTLPPETYWYDHPDWYNNPDDIDKVTQLAWANTEMQVEFAKNVIEDIRGTDDLYYLFGRMDNFDNGSCGPDDPNYQAALERNGGFELGVYLEFTNNVVKIVNEWLEENEPDREIIFGLFAYQYTIEPPVVFNEQTQEYEFANKDLVLEDNIGVLIAPIYGNHLSYGYCDDLNTQKKIFEGWAAILDHLWVWAYSTEFSDYLAPYNSWGSIKQNMMDYKRLGVEYLYEQGMVQRDCPNFMALRQYLVAKLSWDSSLDTDELIYDFIHAYYGDGGEYVYEWFQLLRHRLVELEKQGVYAQVHYSVAPDYFQAEYFPLSLLKKGDELFAKALEATKLSGDTRAYEAVEWDRLSVRYLILQIHASSYSTQEYLSMVDNFEEVMAMHDITSIAEGAYKGQPIGVSELLAKWRKNK